MRPLTPSPQIMAMPAALRQFPVEELERDGYLGIGVKEVWLVDLDLERVFVSRTGGEKDVPHDTSLVWRSPGGRELRIDVTAVFRGVPKGE